LSYPITWIDDGEEVYYLVLGPPPGYPWYCSAVQVREILGYLPAFDDSQEMPNLSGQNV
jgi:hypothetical protein